ncbi:GGDEF domain-containing protein [Companilactobacillus huachuanensis]|uniref:GGDEF domain-containing protein n=1 Tax=Companilactobacillus huachuanensis TaxID=2559914 RepID=A0ABW1RLS2_9LACO|nr:GGDEF domain-containing protein [Companilactobacillus huachuanensis]
MLNSKGIHFDEDLLNSWLGVGYMGIFIISMQMTLVHTSISWQFMNFQLIALIFCAYFLNIHVPYYYLYPLIISYMFINGSFGYWESWCHSIVLLTFYETLNYLRRKQHNDHPFIFYILSGVIFGGLLWFFMREKFGFTWQTYFEEWAYLIIFEMLLYSYVGMILRDTNLKVHLLEFANHDALTKTENYAAYVTEIRNLFDTSFENNLSLSMMMFDIDHFKQVNDTYGHLAGDKVLRHTADVVETVIAENDPNVKLYRTGGEEFNVIFPNYDLSSTEPIVRQIFMALNHLDVELNDKSISITVSVGVSTIAQTDLEPNDFYSRVDGNLYHSKKNGRMQITAK